MPFVLNFGGDCKLKKKLNIWHSKHFYLPLACGVNKCRFSINYNFYKQSIARRRVIRHYT